MRKCQKNDEARMTKPEALALFLGFRASPFIGHPPLHFSVQSLSTQIQTGNTTRPNRQSSGFLHPVCPSCPPPCATRDNQNQLRRSLESRWHSAACDRQSTPDPSK